MRENVQNFEIYTKVLKFPLTYDQSIEVENFNAIQSFQILLLLIDLEEMVDSLGKYVSKLT